MGDTPAGRRGNGLQAADWGALVDLDPRLAEGLLDRLAGAGVAAYVEPASAAGDPWPRAALPNRPLDRLWVDPDRAEAAREVVAAELADLTALLAESPGDETPFGLVQPVPRHAARRVLTPPKLPDPPAAAPAPAPLDEDEVFRQIVAGFDRTADDAVPRWPVPEDTGGPDTPDAPDAPEALGDLDAARRRPPPVDRTPRRRRDDAPLPDWLEPDALDDADLRDPDIDGGHYVPPPPPPAPRFQPRTLGAVALVVLGLVLLFVPQAVGQSATSGTLLVGVLCLGGGAAALVYRVRDAPPHDAGPGDGAVV